MDNLSSGEKRRNDLETTRSSPRQWESQAAESNDSEASTNIADSTERRRMQNRLAQRNHRRRVRAHISALEQRVVENMLQAAPKDTAMSTPSDTSMQTLLPPPSLPSAPPSLVSSSSASSSPPTSASPASQYSTFQTPMGPMTSQSNPGMDDILDFPMGFPQTMDETWGSHAAASQAMSPGCCASSCASMMSGCTSCCDMSRPHTTNTTGGSCCKFHAESSALRPYNHQVHSPPWQDTGMFGYGGEPGANPRDAFARHAYRPPQPSPRAQMSPMHRHFGGAQSMHRPSFSCCHHHKLRSWGPPVPMYPEHMPLHMPPDMLSPPYQPSPFGVHPPSIMSLDSQMHQEYMLDPGSGMCSHGSHPAGYPYDRVYPMPRYY
ncbi:hypothetical protein F5884DRAFT_342160 [Xylogone sp. PMI_703]|nr:hypothetical protein F5884DRAFT_342160 [Xylogone sp. PMI_703]